MKADSNTESLALTGLIYYGIHMTSDGYKLIYIT